jgi:hypothetical protein
MCYDPPERHSFSDRRIYFPGAFVGVGSQEHVNCKFIRIYIF